MTEWKLFEGDTPYVSTFAFHKDRERAPHLEQPIHQPRLAKALEFVKYAALGNGLRTVSDLGCGDGGLLSVMPQDLIAWGYDFQPSNVAGWEERGVKATAADVFGADQADIALGDISIMTEVLEHLADPHGVLRWVAKGSKYLVASSPHNETPESHDGCHAWAWNLPGYHDLFNKNGWQRTMCAIVGQFHVVLSKSTVL